jgi:hypothetical protein
MAGSKTWHRILNAIERLQAKAPADGEGVHLPGPDPAPSTEWKDGAGCSCQRRVGDSLIEETSERGMLWR